MHHHQLTSAAAAAAAAYPNHQFYQPDISHLDQHNNHHNHQTGIDNHNNQWAQHTQHHQLDHHQQIQHQQQHQQHQHQQQQLQHQQSQHTHHQQQQQNYHNQQSQQHTNYYAVINALNGYHHHQQNLDQQHNYTNQCDTNSVVAAVAAANTFAQHHLDHHQEMPQSQPQQQYSQGNEHHAQQYTTTSLSPGSVSVQKSRDTSQTSAINQLQAFALSTPEAAAAAAAAAAAVTFTPFYPPGPTRVNATSFNQTSTLISKAPKIQKQRMASKARPARRQDSSTISNQRGNQQPVTNASRSQRRHAGKASCDCPNCIELERLRRIGLEPAENCGEPTKKLMHVCHHAGCGKEYEKTSHLRAHLRWHTSERLSACRHSDCGKRFTRTDELRKHMKTHHSQPAATSVAKQDK